MENENYTLEYLIMGRKIFIPIKIITDNKKLVIAKVNYKNKMFNPMTMLLSLMPKKNTKTIEDYLKNIIARSTCDITQDTFKYEFGKNLALTRLKIKILSKIDDYITNEMCNINKYTHKMIKNQKQLRNLSKKNLEILRTIEINNKG